MKTAMKFMQKEIQSAITDSKKQYRIPRNNTGQQLRLKSELKPTGLTVKLNNWKGERNTTWLLLNR